MRFIAQSLCTFLHRSDSPYFINAFSLDLHQSLHKAPVGNVLGFFERSYFFYGINAHNHWKVIQE